MRVFSPGRSARPGFYAVAASVTVLLGTGYVVASSALTGSSAPLETALAIARLGIELIAGFYVVSTILKCLDYLLAPSSSVTSQPFVAGPPGEMPRVAILYLCCDDYDPDALRSLCELEYPGHLELIVHDDGGKGPSSLDRRVRAVAEEAGMPVTIMRRPRREGGKAGAVNFVLDRIAARFDLLLMCDNDSTALDRRAIAKCVSHFQDPDVAAVQFRGRGLVRPEDPALVRHLARAIDVFDLFATHQDRHGMMPFLGHNGMVRMSALAEAGGLTAGFLSDDIDISVRWYLSGKRVVYARDIEFAERPPGSYKAFRMRARKWSFGCAQVMRRHAGAVLFTRRLAFARRAGLVEFVGFYAVQVLLAAYLVGAHIVAPLLVSSPHAATLAPEAIIAGTLVMTAIFLPTLAFCLKERRLSEWPGMAWTCCLVYGSTGLETSRGMISGLTRGRLEWIPTNGGITDRFLVARCWSEFGLGVALFIVPLARMPELLAMPVTHLFVANYLFSPIILASYQDGERRQFSLGPLRAGGLPLVVLCVLLAFATACLAATPALGAEVKVKGATVLVDGRPFQLKGIHYSPWPPGTGPGKDYSWPDENSVARDLDLIHSLHANTILVYDDAPADLFDQAAARGLMVMQAFPISWQQIRDDTYVSRRFEEIARRVEMVKGKPNLLAWVLGNEVTEWVYDQAGPEMLAARLGTLAERVRRADPVHPITHGNWPITKDLPLPFLDVVSFNLYPLWPREVVVRGYEEYIRDVLVPLAGGKPLWITEFGLNTLESSPEKQAETIQRCWAAIQRHTAGGVVFSFADEWWKNYDNPITRGKYWEREHAPDDEKAHDLDPEEYYGIMDDHRLPKPAFQTVTRMYGGASVPRVAYLAAPLALLLAYTVYLFTRRS